MKNMLSLNYNGLPIFVMFLWLSYLFIYISAQSVNDTLVGGGAIATWYGDPTGVGSGGACGLANDVASDPYYGLISAGNNKLFKAGVGCGACYQLKCTQNPSCSGFPITVTITDYCPGNCDQQVFHFDLSGTAFGALAKHGQESNLRNAGRINVQFQRVPCRYKSNIKFRIDTGSNAFYLAFVLENVNGDGEVSRVEILPSNRGASWLPMQRSFGATWKVDLNAGTPGPYSVRITNTKTVVAYNIIPSGWQRGQFYYSNVNF